METSAQLNAPPAPAGRAIARGSSVLMLGALFGYGLAALREILIARQFGATAAADAYLVAFALPLLVSSMADFVLAVPFVQTLAAYLARDEEAEAFQIIGTVLNLMLVLALAVVAIGILAAPLLVRLMAPGFAPETELLATGLARWFFPAIMLFVLFGVCRGVLNAYRDFTATALGPTVNHGAVIVLLLLLSPFWGINSLAVGVLAGAALQILILLPALRRRGMRYTPRWKLAHPGVRQLLALAGLITFGGVLQRVGELVTRGLASGLSEGSVAALNYANRIVELPPAIIVSSILTASLPVVVAELQGKEPQRATQTVVASLRVILLLIVPVSIGLVLLAEPLVALLFQNNTFDARATALTSQALACYAPGLAPVAVLMLSGQVLYALNAGRWVVGLAALGVVCTVGLGFLLVGPFQHRGLALAASLAFSCAATGSYLVLRRYLPDLPERELGGLLARLGLAALAMTSVMWGLRTLFSPVAGLLPQLLQIAVVGGLGILAYAGVLLLLRVPEALRLILSARESIYHRLKR